MILQEHDERQSQAGDNYDVLIELMGLVQPSRSLLSFQREMRGRRCTCQPAAEREHRKQPNTNNKLRRLWLFSPLCLFETTALFYLSGRKESRAEENLKIKMQFRAMVNPQYTVFKWVGHAFRVQVLPPRMKLLTPLSKKASSADLQVCQPMGAIV